LIIPDGVASVAHVGLPKCLAASSDTFDATGGTASSHHRVGQVTKVPTSDRSRIQPFYVDRFAKFGQSAKAKTHNMTMLANGTNQRSIHHPLYPAFWMILTTGTIKIANTKITIRKWKMLKLPIACPSVGLGQ
jgi:hypothetical protein